MVRGALGRRRSHARRSLVHSVGASTSDILEFLRSERVAVLCIDRFDDRSPHCNKISGALRLAEDDAAGLTVLCDTDVVVLEDLRRIDVPTAP
jgi:hypothetical protein